MTTGTEPGCGDQNKEAVKETLFVVSRDYQLLTLNYYYERQHPTEESDTLRSLEIWVGSGGTSATVEVTSAADDGEGDKKHSAVNDSDDDDDDDINISINNNNWESDLEKLQMECRHLKTEITSLKISLHPSFLTSSDDSDGSSSSSSNAETPPPKQQGEIPVQLLTFFFQMHPNLSNFECMDLTIVGTTEEFRLWANALEDHNLTRFSVGHSVYSTTTTTTTESLCCDKWEPVIVAILTPNDNNGTLRELRVDWNGKASSEDNDAGCFSHETSRLILETMIEQQQQQQATNRNSTICSLNFPLRFHSLEEAAQYYNILKASNPKQQSNQDTTTMFHCSSPLQENSFMRKFFDIHKFPALPEASIEVVSRRTGNHKSNQSREESDSQSNGNNETAATPEAKTPQPLPPPTTLTIFVTVSKKQIATPHVLTSQLQKLLLSASNEQQQQQQRRQQEDDMVIQVKPPLIAKKQQLELILNPNYLKSQHIYSRFPTDLWDAMVEEASSSIDFYRMVKVLVHEEERILPPGMKKESISALFEWFSAQPNNLLQLLNC